MKRLTLVLCLLFLTVPLCAAEHSATADPAAGAAEQQFPRISKSQIHRPVTVAADDEVLCGYQPSMPNCDFRCRDGVPVLNADGTQRVICWGTPIYPEAPGGVCSRYYDCAYMVPGQVCTWSGNPYTACIFLEGNTLCSTCPWY